MHISYGGCVSCGATGRGRTVAPAGLPALRASLAPQALPSLALSVHKYKYSHASLATQVLLLVQKNKN